MLWKLVLTLILSLVSFFPLLSASASTNSTKVDDVNYIIDGPICPLPGLEQGGVVLVIIVKTEWEGVAGGRYGERIIVRCSAPDTNAEKISAEELRKKSAKAYEIYFRYLKNLRRSFGGC